MALSLADKQAIVSEVAEVAKNSVSLVIADYHGLSVADMTTLRQQARASGVYLRVVRNTLSRRAVEGSDFECVVDTLTGPMCLAFSSEAPGAAARLMRDFGKDHDALEVKALSLGGKLLDVSALKTVANLPTRDEALSQLLFVMKAPVTQLARTLTETYGKLVRTVAAVRDQKQAA